jgi:hypothetical protein
LADAKQELLRDLDVGLRDEASRCSLLMLRLPANKALRGY